MPCEWNKSREREKAEFHGLTGLWVTLKIYNRKSKIM